MKNGFEARLRRFLRFPLFEWNEPQEFVRSMDEYEVRQQPAWVRLLILVGVTLLASGLMYADAVAKNRPLPEWWELTLIPLLAGLCSAYLKVWFKGFGMSAVAISDWRISRRRNRWGKSISFRDVLGYEWIRNTEYGFWTLSLHRTSGSPFLVGVPDTTLRDEIEVVLQQARLKRVA